MGAVPSTAPRHPGTTSLRGSVGRPAAATTEPKASLSMHSAAPEAAGPGVGHACQVERSLESAVFAGAAVAAHDDGVQLEAPLLARARRPWPRRNRPRVGRPSAARGHPWALRRGTRSLRGGRRRPRNARPWSNTSPRRCAPAAIASALRRLEAGQDADVVLGRRAAEQDAHSACANRASAHAA